MEKTFDVIDSSGKVINRVVLAEGVIWNPPAGCTILEADPGSSFGEPPAPIPIPPRDMAVEINKFAVSDEPQARSLRAFGRTVLDAVGSVIAKHNANLDLMVSKGIYTPAEAAQLKMQRRDFATLMATAKQLAINEADPTK